MNTVRGNQGFAKVAALLVTGALAVLGFTHRDAVAKTTKDAVKSVKKMFKK